jgi:glutamate racemase
VKTDDRPIGLFDSGIGGLTVLRSLLAALPNESFVYLGDTARLPYGSKSSATIERYLLQNIAFLNKLNVKAIVVACNSASTVLVDGHLSGSFQVPVYNVIEPGAKAALAASVSKRIGVLGTKATVSANSYATCLLREKIPNTVVFQQACPLLVPLVEEGWVDDPLTNLVIHRYLSPLLSEKIDTLILGCTHYPALRGGIGRVAGSGITLIDSAEAIASAIIADIASSTLGASSGRSPLRPALRLMTTDVSSSFTEISARLMHPHVIPALEAVDIA